MKNTLHFIIKKVLTKLVFLFIPFAAILLLFYPNKSEEICDIISKSIIDPNISSIVTISSVFIGFFATIITVLATSQTDSMTRLIETGKLKPFIGFAQKSLFSSIGIMILSIGSSILCDNQVFIYFYSIVLYYFLFASLRFTYICIYMFRFSIESYELKEKEKRQKEIELIKEDKLHRI